ncbi:unnamed protein product, partial [Oncorhynchus mykiss]
MPPVVIAAFHYWSLVSQAVCKNVRIISARSWNARLIHEEELGGRGNAEDTPVRPIHTAHTVMKGDHLFSNLRKATFYQRVYLLGGEELLVLQSTVGVSTLGDSFHQITDFNDLPTSLFACNVDQSVFEEQDGKVRSNHSLPIYGGDSCTMFPLLFSLRPSLFSFGNPSEEKCDSKVMK